MIKRQEFKITKTARYYSIGELTNFTKEIIFVIHGYGQLAENFIREFEEIKKDDQLIIAPEALNRFYLKGVTGNIGAAWMTAEDRENEINDYIDYLENLYNYIIFNKRDINVKLTILGFSQGSSTACRWLVNSRIEKARLIIWGGNIPRDVNISNLKEKLNEKVTFVIGDNDKFISEEILAGEMDFYSSQKLEYNLIRYSGKHIINSKLLKEIPIL